MVLDVNRKAIDEEDLYHKSLVEPQRCEEFVDAIWCLLADDHARRWVALLLYHRVFLCCKEIFDIEEGRLQRGEITTMHQIANVCQQVFCSPDSHDYENIVCEAVQGICVIRYFLRSWTYSTSKSCFTCRDTIHGVHGALPFSIVGPLLEGWQYLEIAAKLLPVYVLAARVKESGRSPIATHFWCTFFIHLQMFFSMLVTCTLVFGGIVITREM